MIGGRWQVAEMAQADWLMQGWHDDMMYIKKKL
jgi:hypothetical protein